MSMQLASSTVQVHACDPSGVQLPPGVTIMTTTDTAEASYTHIVKDGYKYIVKSNSQPLGPYGFGSAPLPELPGQDVLWDGIGLPLVPFWDCPASGSKVDPAARIRELEELRKSLSRDKQCFLEDCSALDKPPTSLVELPAARVRSGIESKLSFLYNLIQKIKGFNQQITSEAIPGFSAIPEDMLLVIQKKLTILMDALESPMVRYGQRATPMHVFVSLEEVDFFDISLRSSDE